jgi:hypothetical protein
MRVLVAVSLMLAGLLAAAGPGGADEKPAARGKSSYDHLKVLEKAVGQWEGTTDALGGGKVAATLTVEWMLDKQFFKEDLRLKVGEKDIVSVAVYGWDAKTGGMTLHGFAADGDSGSGTAKFGAAAKGKVSRTASMVWVSGRRVGMKQVIAFPEADRMVITDTERTLDGKALPDAKMEWRRKK